MDVKHEELDEVKEILKVNKIQASPCSLHDGAMVLATAGSTLVAGSSNQQLGVLLVVCALVVKWWERRKNHQKPESSTQEPIGQNKKDQDPETRNMKNPMMASRKDEQDPSGTPKESGYGTRSEQDPKRTTGFSAAPFVGKGGRQTPGLRAFRMSSKRNDEEGQRGEHGNAMAASGEASAGVASSAGYGSGEFPAREQTASRAGENRMRQQPAREEVFAVNVTKLAEDLQVRLQITREKKEDTRSTVEHHSQGGAQSGRVPETVIPEVVISGPTTMSTEKVATGTDLYTVMGSTARFEDDETLRARKHEPWMLKRYAHPPVQVASDKWDETLLESDGWVIRSHGKMRKQTFHPLHRCTTIDIKRLHPQRTTVIFDSRGRQVVQDDWMNPKANTLEQVVERWRGYTFFRMERSEAAGSEGPAGSSRATATRFGDGFPNDGRHAGELESDGSYEKIDGS